MHDGDVKEDGDLEFLEALSEFGFAILLESDKVDEVTQADGVELR